MAQSTPDNKNSPHPQLLIKSSFTYVRKVTVCATVIFIFFNCKTVYNILPGHNLSIYVCKHLAHCIILRCATFTQVILCATFHLSKLSNISSISLNICSAVYIFLLPAFRNSPVDLPYCILKFWTYPADYLIFSSRVPFITVFFP